MAKQILYMLPLKKLKQFNKDVHDTGVSIVSVTYAEKGFALVVLDGVSTRKFSEEVDFEEFESAIT